MSANDDAADRILQALRPFASNWTGTLGRGDLVIPQADIPRLVQEILRGVDAVVTGQEAGALDVFEALRETNQLPSVQDRAEALRRRFRILKR